VIGRVGGGFSDQERRDWKSDLGEWAVGSDYTETNDGLGYRMVWPQHVIEISVLDVLSQSTRGQPIPTMCLEWSASEALGGQRCGAWHMVRKMPGVALISPQFVRRREDKCLRLSDVGLDQVAKIVEVPLADRDVRQLELPKSEVLRRAVWTKTLKGQTMVRKLVLWATHKAQPQLPGADADCPAFVLACTDYSPGRAEPLQRDIRVSNSREQIDQLWNELQKEKIVKGWQPA
jgi:hypothetical protein